MAIRQIKPIIEQPQMNFRALRTTAGVENITVPRKVRINASIWPLEDALPRRDILPTNEAISSFWRHFAEETTRQPLSMAATERGSVEKTAGFRHDLW